jgi:hypothetical protein
MIALIRKIVLNKTMNRVRIKSVTSQECAFDYTSRTALAAPLIP